MKGPFRLTQELTPEHEMQIDVARMLVRVLLPDVAWTAIDHAHAKDETTGAIRKARGAKAGIPDLLFWRLGRGFCIELKTLDGVLSPAQRAFHDMLRRAEVPIVICRSAAEVFAAVQSWELTRYARIMA